MKAEIRASLTTFDEAQTAQKSIINYHHTARLKALPHPRIPLFNWKQWLKEWPLALCRYRGES
jgi:hypothetical protein